MTDEDIERQLAEVQEQLRQRFPATIPDDALTAVADNAIRHLLDADRHLKAQSFPSATASAVLSIEELGKLLFLLVSGKSPKGDKHSKHSIPFFGLIFAAEGLGKSQDWGRILRCEEDPANLALTANQQQDIDSHPEFAEFLRRVIAGELSNKKSRQEAWGLAQTAKHAADGTLKRWEATIARGLQHLRLNATYVDVQSDGAWRAPDTTNAGLPEFLCTGALMLLFLFIYVAPAMRPNINVFELGKALPDDLTGLATVAGLIAKLRGVPLEEVERQCNTNCAKSPDAS